ncbi:MAG: adenylosuccinate lyase [Clostridia bacterium]|nr:adenylosuccinate lyase [Clostridia bacterium]
MTDRYESPLASRYASEYMLSLFSQDTRYKTWRRLWTALAKAERALGLPITQEQIDEMTGHIEDIDYECVRQREKEVRHDVMAHIHAFGKAAPKAAGIIHLGATSCFVTDNADLIIYRDALRYLHAQLLQLMKSLADFAEKYKALPVLGYTHYQPAQLVTLGKRASMWLQDIWFGARELSHAAECIRFLGCRGATGTEASFVELFEGDTEKIDRLNTMLANEFDFDSCFDISGQTYPRIIDSFVMNALSAVAQACCRMATDIRLMQHDRQLSEPFADTQVGSSAMAYKRNPIYCERICSLGRYLMTDSVNAHLTASSQWLERTLDDSANRRISIPEGFLCADAIVRLAKSIAGGLKVNEKIIARAVQEYMPFIATENLLMEAVKKGGDRQKMHEIIRRCSMEAIESMNDGKDCDLIERLARTPDFGMNEEELRQALLPERYTGRCAEQVTAFLNKLAPCLEGVELTQTNPEV